MKQLVILVTLAATGVGALAVAGMILIAALHDGDLAPTVISNLQTIALIVVTAVAGVVQHYMATAQPLLSETANPPSAATPSAGASASPVASSVPSNQGA